MNKRIYCKICLKSLLDHSWSEWFEGFDISHRGTETILSGSLPDQSALYGLLNKMRDLGIELVSVVVRDVDGTIDHPVDLSDMSRCL